MQSVAMLFSGNEPVKTVTDEKAPLRTILKREKNRVLLTVLLKDGQDDIVRERTMPADTSSDKLELAMAVLLWNVLKQKTGISPKWGVLTGIRPVKLFHSLYMTYKDTPALREAFCSERLVDESRFELAAQVLDTELPVIEKTGDNDYSLYIGIPFCPTRCRYCSFVSQSVSSAKKLIVPYVDKLCDEIRYAGKCFEKTGMNLRSVYIGGGTPTSLTDKMLRQMISVLCDYFPVCNAEEFTVEAGRPDTIDELKLKTLKEYGVNRLSINPQTLDDSVLKEIGREHTVQQFEDAFRMARNTGFENINCDIIAGLPSDSFTGFVNTLDRLIEYSPEGITVHTLARKRASDISQNMSEHFLNRGIAEQMIDHAYERLKDEGYRPYYLYRQRNILDNLENTGWCKKGFEGLYNIYMMEELHSVIALGAGGVSRLCCLKNGRIERIFNYKHPYEYIDHFDEVLSRKKAAADLLDTF